MQRRSFIASILSTAAAPCIVSAETLMPLRAQRWEDLVVRQHRIDLYRGVGLVRYDIFTDAESFSVCEQRALDRLADEISPNARRAIQRRIISSGIRVHDLIVPDMTGLDPGLYKIGIAH